MHSCESVSGLYFVDGGWDVDNKEKVVVGDGNVSVTCMKPVLDCLWCGGGNIIHIVSPVSLKTEVQLSL